MAAVLLIEDDAEIRSALIRALSERGHAVAAEREGLAGLQYAVQHRPEIVLLDLGLPDITGQALLRMLRAVSAVPVIVITARDDEQEIVTLLDSGADDYVTKPFTADQIDARMRAVLRRGAAETPDAPIVVGGLRIDVRSREATLEGRDLGLARKEFDLLAYLAARPGEVVTKQTLLADVWNQPYGGGDKTVDVHLSWLRRKLGESANAPRFLVSVRGVGVKLVDPSR